VGAKLLSGIGRLLRRVGVLFAVTMVMWPAASFAQSTSKPSAKPAERSACTPEKKDEKDKKDKDKKDKESKDTTPAWKRFAVGQTCVEVSGTLSGSYENVLNTTGRLPLPIRPGFASAKAPRVGTITFTPRFDTKTQTGLGELTTGLGMSVTYTSNPSNTQYTIDDATVSLAGVTVGYTYSVIGFWDGDFQFSANAPSRTVGVARYERTIGKLGKFTLSLETGVPTVPPASNLVMAIYPDDPVLAGRWNRDFGFATVDLAGMFHQQNFDPSNPRVPRLPGQPSHAFGWALNLGANIPIKGFGKDDVVSLQATAAENASGYLGTAVDFSTMASFLPAAIENKGWSAVASLHHGWSERWASNAFVSWLDLNFYLPAAKPSIRTARFGANLIWKVTKDFRVGAEVGFVDLSVHKNGTVSFFSDGFGGHQWTSFLFAEYSF